MDIFSVFTLLGGLAFFLFGMRTMSHSLEKMAGSKLESTLKRITSNAAKSLLWGAGITIAIQSSSALTVMLVGLVNSGIMELGQTIGVIMGSNIGTTLTAWLLSLSGIESTNIFVRLLKPESFSPILALIGIAMVMLSKKQKRRDIGEILLGFSILMFGMELMANAMEPLQNSASFNSILTAFNSPLLGVLVGAVFTGIIQSSAASVGILQALSLTGSVTYGMAIPIIMGQNIGTCVTALISSIGTNKNAKRVAAVHVFFNVIGTAICLIVFFVLNALFGEWFATSVSPLGIAVSHTIFNVTTTAMLLPFKKLLEKLAILVVRDKAEHADIQPETELIDERLFLTPSFAVAECRNLTVNMSNMAYDTINSAIALIDNYDEERAAQITISEDLLDRYEDKLGNYLVRLSSNELTEAQSNEVTRLLTMIGELERIGDHAVNILQAAAEMRDKDITFSDNAKKELAITTAALREIMSITNKAFESSDAELAKKVEPLEQVIDILMLELKERHIARLLAGSCTIELGFILSDILANYERVSDHCSNIAVSVIQLASPTLDAHIYLNEVKSGEDNFVRMFEEYREKYTLPN